MNEITKRVVTGEVLYSPASIKIKVNIDPAVMRRAAEAAERAKLAMAGMAVRFPFRPDERNVIDQE